MADVVKRTNQRARRDLKILFWMNGAGQPTSVILDAHVSSLTKGGIAGMACVWTVNKGDIMGSLASYEWRRSWAVVIYLTCFLFLFDISSLGQDQKPPLVVPIKGDLQSPNPPVKPNPLDDDKTINWTLNDAIQTALENNVDIAIERKNVRIAEYSLTAAEGIYDSVFTASPNFVSNIQPNIGRFSGVSASSNSTNTTTFSSGLGLQKQIEYGGGSFSTNFANQRTTSNSGIVSPLFSPQLSFSFTQPLWRNRHIDLTAARSTSPKRQ